MAAVVDDSTVMYNTYTGNGFKEDSSIGQSQGENRKQSVSKHPASAGQLTVNRQTTDIQKSTESTVNMPTANAALTVNCRKG